MTTNTPDTLVSNALQPGVQAPDFSLLAAPGQKVRLSELEGPVVLIFYPADWSPVCGDELSMFESANNLFSDRGAQLVGIAVDGVWSHVAFKADRRLNFPLLADFHPKGEVARAYGVYRDQDGVTERALFVLNAEHDVAWSYVSPIGISPGVDGALRAVEALS
ncbi:MAG TPA: redoxin domain-containing protein [Acidimicrobiales bacterium]|nr:redoxin domain-containing protein [Acidimicrobiales bacterium]